MGEFNDDGKLMESTTVENALFMFLKMI